MHRECTGAHSQPWLMGVQPRLLLFSFSLPCFLFGAVIFATTEDEGDTFSGGTQPGRHKEAMLSSVVRSLYMLRRSYSYFDPIPVSRNANIPTRFIHQRP